MIADRNCFACSTDGKPVSWIVIGVITDASDLFMYFGILFGLLFCRGLVRNSTALLIVQNSSRCGFAYFHLGAHFP